MDLSRVDCAVAVVTAWPESLCFCISGQKLRSLARLSVHSSRFLCFSLATGKVQFQNLCSVAGDQKSKVLLHSDSTKKCLKNEHEQVSGSQQGDRSKVRLRSGNL